MTASADHERAPLPLGAVGWGITLTMFAFGFWGYLMRSGMLSTPPAVDETSAGWIVLAVLSGVMQFGAAMGAKALRRSKSFDLDASKILSGVLVAGGATVTGCAVHNALQVTGMDPVSAILIAAGVPVCEFAVWWVDESLVSEAETRKASAQDEDLERSRAEARGVRHFGHLQAMTDSMLDKAISDTTALKRNLEVERGRRRKKKLRTNED